ncbi:MAG: hypothetical protein U0U09_19300 [Cyclobacteriaceae bacterium]
MITLKSWPSGQDFCFMNKPGQIYRVINTLSIDVALGAVCCAAWFARGLNVQLRPYAFLALGLTVWIIYTADHLIDAAKINKEASTFRHRFHQRYFKILAACLLLAVVVDFGLLFFIRLKILYAGIGLFLIVIVYLLVNRWLSFLKEIMIAIVYCSGVLLPALSLRGTLLSITEFLWITCFFLTTLINLILFSVYDAQSDEADGNNSFVLTFGLPSTRKVLTLLFVLQFVMMVVLVALQLWITAGILLTMNAVLLLLFIKPLLFRSFEAYRLYGDVIFLFPVVLLIVG